MVFDLLFRTGPAIQALFELGFEPKEDLFRELAPEHFQRLREEGENMDQPWFALHPPDSDPGNPELMIVAADQKQSLLDAVGFLDTFLRDSLKGEPPASFIDRLVLAASILPSDFSERAQHPRLKEAHEKACRDEQAAERNR